MTIVHPGGLHLSHPDPQHGEGEGGLHLLPALLALGRSRRAVGLAPAPGPPPGPRTWPQPSHLPGLGSSLPGGRTQRPAQCTHEGNTNGGNVQIQSNPVHLEQCEQCLPAPPEHPESVLTSLPEEALHPGDSEDRHDVLAQSGGGEAEGRDHTRRPPARHPLWDPQVSAFLEGDVVVNVDNLEEGRGKEQNRIPLHWRGPPAHYPDAWEGEVSLGLEILADF